MNPVLYDHVGRVPKAARTRLPAEPEGFNYSLHGQRPLRHDWQRYPQGHGMWYHRDRAIYEEHPFLHHIEATGKALEGDVKRFFEYKAAEDGLDAIMKHY